MGTRADFYVGRGSESEWIGSIAWDGYPDGIPKSLLCSREKVEFLNEVATFFSEREDVTAPRDGWPWPWDDSGTTDYAYCFDGGRVWWFGYSETDEDEDEAWRTVSGEIDRETPEAYPDMSRKKNVTFGPRSGLTIFTSRGPA